MTIGILTIGYTGGGSAPDEITLHRLASGKLEVKTGNGANQAVILDGSGNLPALNASALTAIPTGEGHIMIFPANYSAIIQGAWAYVILNTLVNNSTFDNNASRAQNDRIDFKVFLAAGTYSIRTVSNKGTDEGIYTFLVDGSAFATIDGYNAANGVNNINTATGCTVATSGLKTLSLIVATKNGSSTAYTARIN